MRRVLVVLVAASVVLLCQVLPASGLDTYQQNIKPNADNTVRQTTWMYYSKYKCADGVTDRVLITSAAVKYNRNQGSGRKIRVTHMNIVELGRGCQSHLNLDQSTPYAYPDFGGSTTTPKYSFPVSFHWSILPVPGSMFVIGVSAHAYVTKSDGTALNEICEDSLGFNGVQTPVCN